MEVHRAQKDKKGDILVFLSAQDEIDRAINIATRAFVEDARSVLLLPLHGKLQPEERNRVFAPAPQGRRKVRRMALFSLCFGYRYNISRCLDQQGPPYRF